MRVGDPAYSLPAVGELASTVRESSSWLCGFWRAGRVTNSAPTQARIQGFELAHLKIYPIYELLEHVKGLILQIQSCGVFVTLGNNRTSEKSP